MNKLIGMVSVLATGLVMGSVSTANAAEPSQSIARAQQVSFADLDLSTTDGLTVARARVHQIAANLCSQVADSLDLSRQPNYVKCIDKALSDASPRLEVMAHNTAPVTKVASNRVNE
jgi:UrcA family protein